MRLSLKKQNLKRPVTDKEIEAGLKKKLFTKKSQILDRFIGEFYQAFLRCIPMHLKLFQKAEEEGTLLNSFYKASSTLIP